MIYHLFVIYCFFIIQFSFDFFANVNKKYAYRKIHILYEFLLLIFFIFISIFFLISIYFITFY